MNKAADALYRDNTSGFMNEVKDSSPVPCHNGTKYASATWTLSR
jgi:hypothetical protein